MEAVPGLASYLPKILTECGLAAVILGAWTVWLMVQLAHARKTSESDRAQYMKLYDEKVEASEKMAISLAELRTLVFALQGRGIGDDN
jgi:hypothetical protein